MLEIQTEPAAVASLGQSHAPWPVEIVDRMLSDERTGLQMLHTWLASKRWVHRRVETITFLDEHRVRRHVSVDLTVPEHAPCIELRPGQAVRLLPLAIMRKRTLVNFDLRDHQGGALTLPSVRQNQRLTFTLLQAWARAALGGQQLGRPLLEDLEQIACGAGDETDRAWHHLERSTSSEEPEDEQCGRLMSDHRFVAVIKRLRYCFLLFVVTEAEPLMRLLVKYSYERPITLYVKRTRGALARIIGVRLMTLEMPQPSAEFAQSYHWEIEAPRGVDIVSAKLLGQKWAKRRDFLDDSAAEQCSEIDKSPLLDKADHILRRIDLHTTDVPSGSKTRGVLKLSPQRGGWLHLSTVVAWLSALALLFAAPRLPHPTAAESRPDAIVLLFVTYALILEALLIKPDEHPLAARLLKPFRRAAAVSGLLPLTATFLLVFWAEEAWQETAWFALAGAGLALAVMQTFVIWVLAPGENKEHRSEWTYDAWSQPENGDQDAHRPPLTSVRRRIQWNLAAREASWSTAGRKNFDDDFFGGDVWGPAVHQEVEEAVRDHLNRLS